MKSLKVGFLGYGKMGQIRYNTLNLMENCDVIKICEINDNIKVPPQISITTSPSEIFNSTDINVVIISVPNYLIKSYVISCLDAGKHVFCEKPPGRTVDEIKRVIEVENKTKLLLKYGFNHRYHKSIQMAMELISSKKLGEIVNIRGVYGKSKIISLESGWRSKKKMVGISLEKYPSYMCEVL